MIADQTTGLIRLPRCTRQSTPDERYALMYAIRTFEESLLELFSTGRLAGTTHTCLGQEAVAVGVVSAIDRARDIVFSNHRGHGHFLAYCGEVERLYLEILGEPGGVCGGRGGSQHLCVDNFYSNGIQGGIVPVASGMALAEKRKGSGAIAVAFLGDGTLGEGAVYEAFNIASLWRLPILFVIEHNGYAQSTPSALQLAGDPAARPRAFGIETTEVRSRAVAIIADAAAAAVDRVRGESAPQCLVVYTYRLGPHSKGDDTRDPGELKTAWENDPLVDERRRLTIDPSAVEGAVRAAVEAARDRAMRKGPA